MCPAGLSVIVTSSTASGTPNSSAWKLPAQSSPYRAFMIAIVSGVASTAPCPARA